MCGFFVALAAFALAFVPVTTTNTLPQLLTHPLPALPVPNVVHFVFGLDPTFGHVKFGMIHYMAALDAKLCLEPDKILMHRRFNPLSRCERAHPRERGNAFG